MFGQFFAPLWVKIAAAVFGLLLIVVGVQSWRLGNAQDEIEDQRNELATERAQHAVTRASVDELSFEMARLVTEGEVRAERINEAMSRVADETAPLREEAQRIEREGLGENYVSDLREAGL